MNIKRMISILTNNFFTDFKVRKVKDYLKTQEENKEISLSSKQRIISSLNFFLEHTHELGLKDKCFLDVGCRDGYSLEIVKHHGFKTVKGVELTKFYVDKAKKLGRNVVQGDIHNLKIKSNSYDLVFCRHVIEHTHNPFKALKELYRVLKPEGFLFISFPTEIIPRGKHVCAIPNKKVFKKMITDFDIILLDYSRNAYINCESNELCFIGYKGDDYG